MLGKLYMSDEAVPEPYLCYGCGALATTALQVGYDYAKKTVQWMPLCDDCEASEVKAQRDQYPETENRYGKE